jgi:hypothetical protein
MCTFIHKQADNLVTRQIAGETIIVPVGSGAGQLHAIFTLNPLGSMIWEMLAKATLGQAIVESICRKYEIPPQQAQTDLVGFLNSLHSVGLISSYPQSGG